MQVWFELVCDCSAMVQRPRDELVIGYQKAIKMVVP